jgi:hypothetical protein
MSIHSAALDTLGRAGSHAASPAAGIRRGGAAPPARLAPRATVRLVLLTFGGLLVSLLAALV